jgi:hypothetical protein
MLAPERRFVSVSLNRFAMLPFRPFSGMMRRPNAASLSFSSIFPTASVNLVMKSIRRCSVFGRVVVVGRSVQHLYQIGTSI